MVHCHPDVILERYSIRDPASPRMVGIPFACKERLERHGFNAVVSGTAVNRRLNLTGPIPRRTEYEDVGGPFFLDAGGTRPDPIHDDLALWFETAEGLVVVLGCAHAGIVNTVDCCRRQSGVERVHALIGGFHLVNADENRLTKTIAALRTMDPDLLAACHCTGARAVERLKTAFPETFIECHGGSVFRCR